MKVLGEHLEGRFQFGKWEHQEADFAGRTVKVLEDKVIMHQHKLIMRQRSLAGSPNQTCSLGRTRATPRPR